MALIVSVKEDLLRVMLVDTSGCMIPITDACDDIISYGIHDIFHCYCIRDYIDYFCNCPS